MARPVMSTETARWLVVTVVLQVIWGILSDVLGVSLGWWLVVLVLIDVVLYAAMRYRRREPSRPGPRAEWID